MAGIAGFEPTLLESKSSVLAVTPYPNIYYRVYINNLTTNGLDAFDYPFTNL